MKRALLGFILLITLSFIFLRAYPLSRPSAEVKSYSTEEIAKIYERTVGHITIRLDLKNGSKNLDYFSRGSVFFWTKRAPIVITNAHVVKPEKTITITNENDEETVCDVIGSPSYKFENIKGGIYSADLLSIDEKNDIAYLLIDIKPNEHNIAEVDYDHKSQRGERVCTFTGYGSHNGENYPFSFLDGVISNPEYSDKDGNIFIQTTVRIIDGNSGSPLISLETGKVIGIFVQSDDIYSLAIPIDRFDRHLDQKDIINQKQ